MIKKILKIVAALIVLILVIFGLFVGYVVGFKPGIPVEEITVERTPERIARGRYLAENVAQCVECHSERDWTLVAAPTKPGTEGKGGEKFDRQLGFPGSYVAGNLTPYNLKDWTDGELFRAITAGVGRDGRALFPVMPYPNYGRMDREDIYSIIAYLRSMKPVENRTEASLSDFPMSIIIRMIPSKPEFSTRPAAADKVALGRYLATAAGCAECHTPANRGRIDESLAYGGGRLFQLPTGESVISTNISPDEATGIGGWTEEKFVETFKKRAGPPEAMQPGRTQTMMPWTSYAGMTREDLAAVFAYLKSVKPVATL
jgi:mono/diheme cytochrome c family protein